MERTAPFLTTNFFQMLH